MTDHTYVVAEIRAALVARGVLLIGPCGAFEITKRVAWALREEGAGLLLKNGGNNCVGYAVDIIAYRDGTIVDILVNGGGDEDPSGNAIPGTGNGPAWNVNTEKVDPTRWAAPFPVDADPGTPAPPQIPLPPAAPDADVQQLEAIAAALVDLAREITLQREELRTLTKALTLDRAVILKGLQDLYGVQARGLRGSLFGYSIVLKP
jgi:hypothetical protein